MSLDVEATSLHGVGFAYGYVLFNTDGLVLEERIRYCVRDIVLSDWVKENVKLPYGLDYELPTISELRRDFWKQWLICKYQHKAVLLTDIPWPVETNFLSECIKNENLEDGPYPIIDLGSAILALGGRPTATYDRQSNELPAHNPLNDARQSMRVFLKYVCGVEPNYDRIN